ncbi:uncharacterized protein LOC127713991 [Mytilus californianus]|uniref:uncharacterized protein LOC127713991 n=1 Tax=Mytilus californianus TaxID=6549 RepID=UPI002246FC64|nr:uncharacterized protein LOC127713991 [Mytilus californianus]
MLCCHDAAPPPSYDSVVEQIKQAKKDSDGHVDFVKTCCGILIGSGLFNKKKELGDKEKKLGVGPEQLIINCFVIAWFIAGSVWVYRTYDDWQSSNSTLDNYCNPTLYYFSFWIITISYIGLGLLLVMCLTTCIAMCICGEDE